jgi:hypothetical protein
MAGCAVSLMNIVFLLVGEARAGFPPLSGNGGRRMLHDGPCDETKKINIGVHLIINILGSIILGVSNYCMQCMNAPTRVEIDQAHSKFRWVDIGIPSLRNLDKIRGMRVVLWLLLGSSSVPLHLLYVYILSSMDQTLIEASYNSTVYSTIRATEYAVIAVNEKFIDKNTKTYDRDTSGDHG